MVMLALALGVLTVVLIATTHLISGANTQIGVDSADKAVYEIVEAADFVYVHGHPSKLRIRVYVPPSIREMGIEGGNNRTVYMRLDSAPQYTDVYAVTRGNITGDLSDITQEGYYMLNIESLDNIWANISLVT